MPGTTPLYNWPYQAVTDPPHGPNLGQQLATAIETTVSGVSAAATAADTRITTLHRKLAFKTAIESLPSSILLQNDDELAVAAAANTKFACHLHVLYNGPGGLRMDFTKPAGSFLRAGTAIAGGSGAAIQHVAVTDAAMSITGIAGGGDLMLDLWFQLETAATAGVLQWRWAQDTSNATPTAVGVGSWLRLDPQ